MATTKPRVLLTGAAGRVGTALWQGWEQEDKYDLTLTDVNPIEGATSRVEIGDISDFDFIQKLCQDQDVLVSLAFIRAADTIGEHPDGLTDIGLQMLLFESAVRAGVRKIVYASSNHASGWNERQDPQVKHHPDHIRPDGWYGAMKAMGEAAGRWLVNGHDIHFIAIRIGNFGTVRPSRKPSVPAATDCRLPMPPTSSAVPSTTTGPRNFSSPTVPRTMSMESTTVSSTSLPPRRCLATSRSTT